MAARRCVLKPRAGRRTVRGARRSAYPKTPRQNTVIQNSFQVLQITYNYDIAMKKHMKYNNKQLINQEISTEEKCPDMVVL